jgi:hypothetical protein
MQSLKEMIQDCGERQQELQAKEEAAELPAENGDSIRVDDAHAPRLCILCLPARTEADEITALMAAQVLETDDCAVEAVSVTSLANEMALLIERCATADVICVSATPPAAVMHARHLCKRLRSRFPKTPLVVGLWDAQGDLNKAKERIGCGAIVVITLADAQEQVRLLSEPRSPRPDKRAPAVLGSKVMVGA